MNQCSVSWLVLFVLFCGAVGCSHEERTASTSRTNIPDTSLSVPLDRWPDDNDLQKLKQLKGKGPADVIESIGHPARLEVKDDGVTIWHYDWQACCKIAMKNGVVQEWFYTAGF